MLFWWLLGMYMAFVYPDKDIKSVEQDMDGTAEVFPPPPDLFKRHIPVLEPDSETPTSADRYVRSRR